MDTHGVERSFVNGEFVRIDENTAARIREEVDNFYTGAVCISKFSRSFFKVLTAGLGVRLGILVSYPNEVEHVLAELEQRKGLAEDVLAYALRKQIDALLFPGRLRQIRADYEERIGSSAKVSTNELAGFPSCRSLCAKEKVMLRSGKAIMNIAHIFAEREKLSLAEWRLQHKIV